MLVCEYNLYVKNIYLTVVFVKYVAALDVFYIADGKVGFLRYSCWKSYVEIMYEVMWK